MDNSGNVKFKYADRVNQLQRTNKALIIGFGMFTVFLVAAGLANIAAGTMSVMAVVIVGGIGVAGDIIITLLARAKPEDLTAVNFSVYYLWVILFVGLFFIRMNFVMVCAIFPLIGYMVYNNKKLVTKAAIGVVVISVVSQLIGIFVAKSITNVAAEVMLLLAVTLCCLGAILSANMSTDYMADTVSSLNDQKAEVDAMMNDVLTVAGEVRRGTTDVMEIVDRLTESTNTVTGAVREISEGNLNTAENVQNQTEMTQNIQSAIDDILDKAKEMVEIARDSEEVNENSITIMDHLRSQSETIRDTNNEVAATMKSLQEKAGSVKGVVDTILSISNQTNLLALNASIESARAGEAGRGFAVVADEIRELAEKTKTETENIAAVLDELSANAEAAAGAVDSSVEATNAEEKLIEEASDSFNAINKDIKELTGNISDIDGMLHALSDDNTKIVDAISQLSATSEQVSASSSQAESLSNENLENADSARETLNAVMEVSAKLDKYTN
ncbi:MAG: hypothetical protein K6B14_08375 [Lachnospiraceae bacterium]|nr:hypothetical protein [Lachnospiraceae bacterium]